jgi:hypothetical protein
MYAMEVVSLSFLRCTFGELSICTTFLTAEIGMIFLIKEEAGHWHL